MCSTITYVLWVGMRPPAVAGEMPILEKTYLASIVLDDRGEATLGYQYYFWLLRSTSSIFERWGGGLVRMFYPFPLSTLVGSWGLCAKETAIR